MYAVFYTVRYKTLTTTTDRDFYFIKSTREEAEAKVQDILQRNDEELLCYGIGEIIESSEPHWMAKPADPAVPTESEDAWGTDK